jgi:hypothetical protein
MVMLRFLLHAPVFLAFPPTPLLLLFTLNLPCRLVAMADALLGMVNSNLLLLLLLAINSMPLSSVSLYDNNPATCTGLKNARQESASVAACALRQPSLLPATDPFGQNPQTESWQFPSITS